MISGIKRHHLIFESDWNYLNLIYRSSLKRWRYNFRQHCVRMRMQKILYNTAKKMLQTIQSASQPFKNISKRGYMSFSSDLAMISEIVIFSSASGSTFVLNEQFAGGTLLISAAICKSAFLRSA